jgi:cellulose synthase/poly-beta-1,6-N-acetylglucosamine synthase-like glycosyltransferase
MVYYGKGFTWSELYDMPVWLRKFYYKKTIEAKEKEKKDQDSLKAKKFNKSKISKPNLRKSK